MTTLNPQLDMTIQSTWCHREDHDFFLTSAPLHAQQDCIPTLHTWATKGISWAESLQPHIILLPFISWIPENVHLSGYRLYKPTEQTSCPCISKLPYIIKGLPAFPGPISSHCMRSESKAPWILVPSHLADPRNLGAPGAVVVKEFCSAMPLLLLRYFLANRTRDFDGFHVKVSRVEIQWLHNS